MKHLILFASLLALTVSCKNNTGTPATAADTDTKEITRLLTEANNLWLFPTDTTFIRNDSTEHISINDKEILAKLDSALAINPTNIKAYIGKISYLTACRKFREILPILKEAARNASFNAELWSMKAIFEDCYGDSAIAQKDYHSADSAFAIELEKHPTDSLKYPALRLGQAMNKALMTDNFTLVEEELKLTRKVFPGSWEGGLDDNFPKNKKEYFDRFLNFRK